MAARLLGWPGEPSARVVRIGPLASSQLPRVRISSSGQPESQRTRARMVPVPLLGSVALIAPRMTFMPVWTRSEARSRSARWPSKAPVTGSIAERSCVPMKRQSGVSLSNEGLLTRFAPPAARTSTASIRHSPASMSPMCISFGSPLELAVKPWSMRPVNSSVVHALFCDSSLAAQLRASEGSARGSIRSSELPPPSASACHSPPSR